ncbi:MAG: S8 family peptidase [Acidobacteria bacterium]|nr:S8 family peptidase [Acidobacteriota bacterium]
MKWKRALPVFVGLCLLVSASIAIGENPQRTIPLEEQFAFMTPTKLPMIVVFRNEVTTMAAGKSLYQADPRFESDPALAYLDRNIIGAVQLYERNLNFRADRVYSAALRGFAADLTLDQISKLKSDPRIAALVPDGIATINQGNRPGGGGGGQTLPWGIDRIDADTSSTKAGDGTGTISNVNVYIIDTGADADHADLNVVNHVNFAGGPNKDCNGHGTHVAGTVAARDNDIDVVGVAPGAPITGVKVLGCGGSGTWSGVISGVDWVTANAVKPAIANMSLGGGANDAVDTAVINSADSGVFYALAAGNDGADACESSPARAGTHDGVMTTAATDSSDSETSWSNYGPCVDIWAPGASILSTKSGGGTTTMSGTSMASPHAGGTGALYLSSSTSSSASQTENALKSNAVSTGTTSKDGTAISLVYAGKF